MASLSEMAKATAQRSFELPAEMTLEELFNKLSAQKTAFKMPFSIKKGIMGENIAFEKEPDSKVIIHVSVKGTTIKITPNITSDGSGGSLSVGGMSMPINGSDSVMDMHTRQGEYISAVTEAIKRIAKGETVQAYAPPVQATAAAGAAPTAGGKSDKNWLTVLILILFAGGIGAHQFYVGNKGKAILYFFTFGLFGIGTLIDLFKLLTGKFTDKDGNIISKD